MAHLDSRWETLTQGPNVLCFRWSRGEGGRRTASLPRIDPAALNVDGRPLQRCYCSILSCSLSLQHHLHAYFTCLFSLLGSHARGVGGVMQRVWLRRRSRREGATRIPPTVPRKPSGRARTPSSKDRHDCEIFSVSAKGLIVFRCVPELNWGLVQGETQLLPKENKL